MKQSRLMLATLALLVTVALLTVAPSEWARAVSYSLNVITVGQGDVTVDPPGPYSAGQVVTLTADPDPGWEFDSWSLPNKNKWWDQDWDYRVPVTVAAAGYAREDKPAEAQINFTTLLADLGVNGSLDVKSIRVIEVDADGNILDTDIIFQFDPGTGFIASTNALGTLVWMMEGKTNASESRYYHVYFDVTGKGFVAPTFTPLISLQGPVSDERQASYKITTPTGTYYYHQKGAGFSSLDDIDGNDWISYKDAVDASGSNGPFRGIPNLVHPNNGGHFHPGIRSADSTIRNQGPLKITIYSLVPIKTSKWEGTWSFYPDYATLNLTIATFNYWFLYEGTPGGKLDLNDDYMVLADGTQYLAKESWTKDLPGDEWAYFVDPALGRSLFFANHNNDSKTDSYAPADGVMTKFGFGRTGTSFLLEAVPAQFTIGLMDETDPVAAAAIITNAYKPLDVTLGEAEASMGGELAQGNPLLFTIEGEHEITATFVPIEYALDVTIQGNGSVQRTPDKPLYLENETVQLAAVADPDWIFTGWSGDLSGRTNPRIVTMAQDLAVTASFAPAVEVATSTTAGQGQIVLDPPGGLYAVGTPVKLTAVGEPGWAFDAWGGDLAGMLDNPVTVVVNEDLAATASFVEETYALDITKVGDGNVTASPQKDEYSYGDTVQLTAQPGSGYVFTGWQGAVTGTDNPLLLTITGDTTLTATFEVIQNYELTINIVGQGKVTKNPDQTVYQTGQKVILTASGSPGWNFTGWSGDATGTDNSVEILILSNKEVTATFGKTESQSVYLPLGMAP